MSELPLFEAIVPQTGELAKWSIPAQTLEEAADKAAKWCLRCAWVGADSTHYGDSVEFAIKRAGTSDWTWFEVQARVKLRLRVIGVDPGSLCARRLASPRSVAPTIYG